MRDLGRSGRLIDSFEPEIGEAIRAAYRMACEALQLEDQIDGLTDDIAKNILELGACGSWGDRPRTSLGQSIAQIVALASRGLSRRGFRYDVAARPPPLQALPKLGEARRSRCVAEPSPQRHGESLLS